MTQNSCAVGMRNAILRNHLNRNMIKNLNWWEATSWLFTKRGQVETGATENKSHITKYCLCNYICKWLDFLVFSDKDNKPLAQSHNPSMFIILWDVKGPTHLSQRVGPGVPGVVVCLPWVGGRVNSYSKMAVI